MTQRALSVTQRALSKSRATQVGGLDECIAYLKEKRDDLVAECEERKLKVHEKQQVRRNSLNAHRDREGSSNTRARGELLEHANGFSNGLLGDF